MAKIFLVVPDAPVEDTAQLKATRTLGSGIRLGLLNNSKGTVMVVVNSICGCAAGKARPGIAQALQHDVKPEKVATVFAGADIEATEKARSYFTGYQPSSPSIALLKDGELVWMMERREIEGKAASQVAAELKQAFDQHCAKTEATVS